MQLAGRSDPFDGMSAQPDRAAGVPGEGSYLLPPVLRRSSKWLAIFTAYSQFVSVAFLFAYRSQDAWVQGQGYVTNTGIFGKFLVPALLFPYGKIGMFAIYPIWLTVSAGALLAATGSVGLFCIGYARGTWRWRRAMLFLAFLLGLATAAIVCLVHVVEGASRVNFLGAELDNYYFLHGLLEFLGATAFPFLAYSALTLWLLAITLSSLVGGRKNEH